MAEPEKQTEAKNDEGAETPAENAPEQETEFEETDVEEYSGLGFDPEQRRFLWTLTGVIILGMGAASWIITSHDDRARQNFFKVTELGEIHRALQQRLAQAQQADIQRLASAEIQNDENAYKIFMNDLVENFLKERQSFADYHRAAGLDDVPITDQTRTDFEDKMKSNANELVEQYRRQQAASTQPAATRPAGSMPRNP